MESLEAMQARHRKEQRDLQGRITNKKKNATKKSRKGVNDECAELELQLKERHEQEITTLAGTGDNTKNTPDEAEEQDENLPDQHTNDTTNGITQQLEQTSLSSAIPSHPESESPTSQQQQANKKRNRQKERMARRAAEQEAAAIAAEEEASNMTDHRKIEKTYLLKEFKANQLVEKEIQPDGHCLFSAVADQLQNRSIPLGVPESETKGKPPPAYRVVRRAATDYMEAHADDFAPFLEEPLASYVTKIRDTAEWGGQLELAALAGAYGVEIRVLQDGRTETIEPSAGREGEGEGERQTIWLAYYRHGYGLGEHYNSLRKAE
ncbi:cysteine proteinase [Hypoxylon rubiginosum]|uniref:Cysteine proteinase n=1 Tax=Hypoxylon rubiginosum TaxID=110542 RepID=A0ACB9YV81_9PEZI|nr:cysteine proteinase [Hypoxylon rubiginosum]